LFQQQHHSIISNWLENSSISFPGNTINHQRKNPPKKRAINSRLSYLWKVIFTIDLGTPSKDFDVMNRLHIVFLVLGLALVAMSCSQDENEESGPPAGAAQHGGKHGPSGKRPGQQAIPVAVTQAVVGSIASYYDATATLEAEKNAEILARATGVVAAISAEEGDLVAAGEPLLTIDNDEYRLRLEQAKAASANLRARFVRFESMRAEGLSTDEEFQAAKSDLASAVADEDLARLALSYVTVRAPFSGRVIKRLVDVGQNLSTGTALFDLADFDPLLARVHVPSREFNALQRDQAVNLVLDSTGDRLKGHIKLISPVIDPASGTIKLTIEVAEYPMNTRPGDFAQVRIVTERRDGVVLVPRSAVLTDQGESVVYVAMDGDEGKTAERRVVQVGFMDDENAQILTGLSELEPVVTKGQRSLKHGAALKILEGASD
jgi:membrane fusion protein (multidrug efflux system)